MPDPDGRSFRDHSNATPIRFIGALLAVRIMRGAVAVPMHPFEHVQVLRHDGSIEASSDDL